ncbi:hypothetical protein LN470_19120 [Xanthomonas phaseoli]|nr:hypothetical protein [Xanthomonas phaseoli]
MTTVRQATGARDMAQAGNRKKTRSGVTQYRCRFVATLEQIDRFSVLLRTASAQGDMAWRRDAGVPPDRRQPLDKATEEVSPATFPVNMATTVTCARSSARSLRQIAAFLQAPKSP